MSDTADLLRVLMEHGDKNFVQRILQPGAFPKLDLGGGQVATHKMAWGEDGGKFYVFPTLVMSRGKLVDLGDRAFDYAAQTGERIEFPTAEAADQFSKSYKNVWTP